jgi:hypothetical protein
LRASASNVASSLRLAVVNQDARALDVNRVRATKNASITGYAQRFGRSADVAEHRRRIAADQCTVVERRSKNATIPTELFASLCPHEALTRKFLFQIHSQTRGPCLKARSAEISRRVKQVGSLLQRFPRR